MVSLTLNTVQGIDVNIIFSGLRRPCLVDLNSSLTGLMV